MTPDIEPRRRSTKTRLLLGLCLVVLVYVLNGQSCEGAYRSAQITRKRSADRRAAERRRRQILTAVGAALLTVVATSVAPANVGLSCFHPNSCALVRIHGASHVGAALRDAPPLFGHFAIPAIVASRAFLGGPVACNRLQPVLCIGLAVLRATTTVLACLPARTLLDVSLANHTHSGAGIA